MIARAASICDQLVVGIGKNITKGKAILTMDERIEVLKKETASFKNVEISSFQGLTTTFAKSIQVDVLIRGLRSGNDLEFEKQMANANLLNGI